MPPQFGALNDDVKGLLFAGFPAAGDWALESSLANPTKDSPLAVNPSANSTKGGVCVDVGYRFANGVVANVKTNRSWELVGATASFDLDAHSFVIDPKDGGVSHSWCDETFSTNITTEVFDGLASRGGFTCNAAEGVVAGVSYAFDPYRSGLRDYRFAALISRKLPLVKAGTCLYLSCGGMEGVGVAAAIPFCPDATFVVSYDQADKLLVGTQMRFPSGVTAAVFGRVCDRFLTLSASKALGQWVAAVTAQVDLVNVASRPKVGVSITSA